MSARKDGKQKKIRSDRKTHEQYIAELEKIHNGTILMLNKYTTKRNKGKFKCLACNWIWESQAGNLIKNNNPSHCPNCSKLKLKKRITEMNNKKVQTTKAIVPIRIKEIYGDEYELLSEYEHHRKKLILKCKYHGLFKQRYDSLLGGHGCPMCGNNHKTEKILFHNEAKRILAAKMFNEKIKSEFKDEYIQLTEYQTVNDYVKLKHITCGYEWDITPANFLWNNRRCPQCRLSKSMKVIEHVVKDNNLKYTLEKGFTECKNKRILPFDIFIHNNTLVEYDGEQHFNPIDFNGEGVSKAKVRMTETQLHDKIKNQYCIDNNIPLIRIPYWEFNNIEYILENVLKHYNLIDSDNTYDKEIVYKYLVDEHWDHDIYLKWNDKENRDLPMKQLLIK